MREKLSSSMVTVAFAAATVVFPAATTLAQLAQIQPSTTGKSML
jgi:hypothetical protein